MSLKENIRVRNFDKDDLFRIIDTEPVHDRFLSNGFDVEFREDEYISEVEVEGHGQRWLLYRLRDRAKDGPGSESSPLEDWGHDHSDDEFTLGSAVEHSHYWGDPDYPLELKYPQEVAEFITSPFEAMPFEDPTRQNLEEWLMLWGEVVGSEDPPYPGQFSLKSVPGMFGHVYNTSKEVLSEKGYDYLTSIPTWVHVAQISRYFGMDFMYQEDLEKFAKLEARLPEDRKLASWVGMLQFWNELADDIGLMPEEYLDTDFVIRDGKGGIVTYPLTPERNLWMLEEVK